MVIGNETEMGIMLRRITKHLDLKSLTDAELFQLLNEESERREKYNSRYQLNSIKSKAEQILLGYGVGPEGKSVLTYAPIDNLSSDAKSVVKHSGQAIAAMDSNNIERAVYDALLAVNAFWRMYIRPFESDTGLGKSRRESNKVFAKRRGKDLHEEREKYWAPVRKEAKNIAVAKPHIANNKSELARRVKKTLNLKDPVGTIRRKI